MNNNVSCISFLDENTNCEFLLVQDGNRSGLWNKTETNSLDLAAEVDNWLHPSQEMEDYENEDM
jgi:hypothetical protein